MRQLSPVGRRYGDDPHRGGDARLHALMDLLSAPARPSELGDESRINALFIANREGFLAHREGILTARGTAEPAHPRASTHRAATEQRVFSGLSAGLGTALNTVVVAAALAVRSC